MAGCSHGKIGPVPSAEAIASLEERSSQVKTCRGRAWISVKSPEGKASFAGVVVIDRSIAEQPKLRIEALDPFGTLHHLITITEAPVPKGRAGSPREPLLQWADFDAHHLGTAVRTWQGVPLGLFSNLLLGAVSTSTLKKGQWRVLPAADQHLALEYRGMSGGDPVTVDYSQFQNESDFPLPMEVNLTSSRLEVRLSWRERSWNESLEPSLFEMPAGRVSSFTRESL